MTLSSEARRTVALLGMTQDAGQREAILNELIIQDDLPRTIERFAGIIDGLLIALDAVLEQTGTETVVRRNLFELANRPDTDGI